MYVYIYVCVCVSKFIKKCHTQTNTSLSAPSADKQTCNYNRVQSAQTTPPSPPNHRIIYINTYIYIYIYIIYIYNLSAIAVVDKRVLNYHIYRWKEQNNYVGEK